LHILSGKDVEVQLQIIFKNCCFKKKSLYNN